MGTDNGKKILFSIDQFIILIAWLGTVFAILCLKAYEMIIPSIAAFVVLSLALGIWINKTTRPVKHSCYRKCLIIQTLFLLVWCPLLGLLLATNRTDLLPIWIIILVAFYIGIGVASLRSAFSNRHKVSENHGHKKAEEHSRHKKKAVKRKKK